MGNIDRREVRISQLETNVEEANRQTEALRAKLDGLIREKEQLSAENMRLRRSDEEMEEFRAELVDIRLQLAERLREAEEEAAAARERSEHLGAIAHEIRTRLNGLLILARQRALDGDAGKHADYAGRITGSASELQGLIADFLDVNDPEPLREDKLRPKLGAIRDDRDVIEPGDRVILTITKNERLARSLLEAGHDRGFESVITDNGEAGVRLARDCGPDAIMLDHRISEAGDGSILDTLKRDPETRHIPVYVYAARADAVDALQRGANGILWKPGTRKTVVDTLTAIEKFISTPVRRVLVAGENSARRRAIVDAIVDEDVEIMLASSGEEALKMIEDDAFACVVVRCSLPDMSALGLLMRIPPSPAAHLPVVIDVGERCPPAQATQLAELARTRVVRKCHSLLGLLDETAVFLHRTEAQLQSLRSEVIAQAEGDLTGRRVLIVDDDKRNLFAMSAFLDDQGMEVEQAESGKEALARLDADPRPDIVLMDIMMPEMDGFETTRRIREKPGFAGLPVIALTAKAMKGDREACLAAGASDYMSKPVDTDKLVALMKAWLQ